MMPTQSQGGGAFERLDLSRVPSPCFVIDEAKLRANLRLLRSVSERSGVKILSALKAFSMWSVAPLISEHLDGVCTSGLWETRLAKKHYTGEVTTYCAGYREADIDELAASSQHLIFNSEGALRRFGARVVAHGCQVGVRLNPLHSEGLIPKYDPCAPGSRLGLPITRLEALLSDPELGPLISGVHMHTLCEQTFTPLKRTWEAAEPYLKPHYGRLKWINLGGGHHITREGYEVDELVNFLKTLREASGAQLYLEPGEAVAFEAGVLVGEVLDVMTTDTLTAILDISATCHMPDVIEAPYRPALLSEVEGEVEGESEREQGVEVLLGGPSCLAGDVLGRYRFARVPQIGERIAFLDQAHYSMVKTNTFNGVPLPSIALWDSERDTLEVVRSFGWEEFERRLS